MTTSLNARSGLRWTAASVAGLIAGVYLLIGTEVVRVPGVAEVEPGPAMPLLIAGAAFAILAAGLAWRPARSATPTGSTPPREHTRRS